MKQKIQKKVPGISDAEMEVMQIIWKKGEPVTSTELQTVLEASGKEWKINTILTFLARLTEKGILSAERKGRSNQYTALISEEEYKHYETLSFLNTVHGGSVKNFMAALFDGDELSREDISELREWFEEERNRS